MTEIARNVHQERPSISFPNDKPLSLTLRTSTASRPRLSCIYSSLQLHMWHYRCRLPHVSNAVFFEDMTDEVRAGAQDVARLIASPSPATRAQVLEALATQPALSDLVAALAARLVRDIAAGRHPVYVTTEDEVSPAEAARLLGVSRQYVDRLLADGRLPYTRKPDSTHRTISVANIETLINERSRRRSNTDKAITALLEGGLEY